MQTPTIDQLLNAVAFLEGNHPEVAELLRKMAEQHTAAVNDHGSRDTVNETHPPEASNDDT